MLTADTAN
ncbi:unnamed protein product, partial [Rotaria sp. Silwood1]